MDEFLRSHPLVAWVGAGLAFVVFVILLLHMAKILLELRRRMPSGERSRQLRLGFVENFDLDGERQLLLVRRDNVEHLLLIGGPNDVLVESGIVRAEARAPRGGLEAPGQVAPSALVLAPALGHGQELARPEAPSPDALPAARPEVVRFEPKPASQLSTRPQEPKVEPEPEPRREPLPEIDLEEELKAALEAAPLAPSEQPAAVEPPPPPAPPPSRFTPPPRPSFRAPLPPRPSLPQVGVPGGLPGAPPAQGGDQPSRPRFVIPPLARRNPAPPASPLAEPPPPAPVADESPQPAAEPPAPDQFAPPEPKKPEPEAPQAPPPRPDPETLESLEEEMAKLLGRPPRP